MVLFVNKKEGQTKVLIRFGIKNNLNPKGPPQLIKSVRIGFLMKFIITIRYKIPMFSSVGPFFEEGGGGPENFGQKLIFWEIFK